MLPIEKREKTIELRESGLTYKQIAQKLGVSATWVRGLCVQSGMAGHFAANLRHEEYKKYKATGKTAQEVANHFGISKDRAKAVCVGIDSQAGKRNQKTEKEATAYVNGMLRDGFSYVGGYTNCESMVTIRCDKCGYVFHRSMVAIRHGLSTTCDSCQQSKQEKRRADARLILESKNKKREEKREQKINEREQRKRIVLCVECGKEFVTYKQRQICCSSDCSKKRSNRIASHRKDSRIAKEKRRDGDITVKKLYERDNGVCWICGGKCDLDDFTIRNGTVICGNYYPSIDHVVPVSDGGEDSWDNVRLAHRICNTKRFHQKATPPINRNCA